MTNRELLESAAMASGLQWSNDPEITHDGLWITAPADKINTYWNPLAHNGDAFLLAVTLGITITPYPVYAPDKHLLGPIDLEEVPVGMSGPLRSYGGSEFDTPGLEWVVCGGESGGPNARPMHPDWAEDLQSQCEEAGVPFFFKQWGEWCPCNQMTDTEIGELHRSNRIAKNGEDQSTLDEIFGTHCTVPATVVGTDGGCLAVTDPMAFWTGRGGMTTFRVGVRKAGCKLGGKERQEWPAVGSKESV